MLASAATSACADRREIDFLTADAP